MHQSRFIGSVASASAQSELFRGERRRVHGYARPRAQPVYAITRSRGSDMVPMLRTLHSECSNAIGCNCSNLAALSTAWERFNARVEYGRLFAQRINCDRDYYTLDTLLEADSEEYLVRNKYGYEV